MYYVLLGCVFGREKQAWWEMSVMKWEILLRNREEVSESMGKHLGCGGQEMRMWMFVWP